MSARPRRMARVVAPRPGAWVRDPGGGRTDRGAGLTVGAGIGSRVSRAMGSPLQQGLPEEGRHPPLVLLTSRIVTGDVVCAGDDPELLGLSRRRVQLLRLGDRRGE